MKKILLFTAVFIFAVSSVSFSQAKGFGIGIIAGEPTGLSFKTWLNNTSAIDAGLGWSFVKEGSIHIHADYLHHFGGIDVSSGNLPFYIGVGGRIKIKNNDHNDSDTRIGVRVPVGITYIPASTPIDVFLEVVPILDLAPESALEFNAAIGIRYYIN
jgi:hypothetical protein